jgi:hypothetical protein
LFRFEIGIQTVNQKANLEVSRKQNFNKTKEIIESVRHKIELHLDLIVGLPLDLWEDVKYSFEEVFKLHAPELQLGFLKFLKGTPVREKYEQHGFVFDKTAPYQIIRSNYLSEQQLMRITMLEHALEIYWNKKRAINTLKYITAKYSSFDFLESLGTFFETQKDFHNYTLNDVYLILAEFVKKNYPEDIILQELIAIDYYLSHKIRPKAWFDFEVSREERNALINERGLDHHKFRFVIMQLSFDYNVYKPEQDTDVKGDYKLVFCYNGTEYPRIIAEDPALHLN